MKVRFYSFNKRMNSTKVPATSDSYTELECHLLENTSVLKPVLDVSTINPVAYNFAYIPTWNRYYFIENVESVENRWYIHLRVDVLASFKTAIGSTSCDILYATGSTKNIVDSRIPVLANVSTSHSSSSLSGISILDQGGQNIIGVTGKGSFGPYVCNNLNEILDDVDNWWNNLSISNVWDALKQFIYGGSAADCLRSAIRIPLTWTETVGPSESLYLGNYPCKDNGGNSITGLHIIQPIVSGSASVSIPWPASSWLRVSQYSTVIMYLPLVGMITLPATELQNEASITVEYKVNITSGDVSVLYSGGSTGKHYGTASANIAQNTAYGSTGIDTNKATQSVVTGVGTIVTGVALGGLTGGLSTAATLGIGAGLMKAAGDAIGALGGTSSGSGGLGGGASNALDKDVHIWVVTKQLTETPTNLDPIIGKPYMGVSTPANFSGFVQTDGFEFSSATAYSAEKEQINSMLDSGIYYE